MGRRREGGGGKGRREGEEGRGGGKGRREGEEGMEEASVAVFLPGHWVGSIPTTCTDMT